MIAEQQESTKVGEDLRLVGRGFFQGTMQLEDFFTRRKIVSVDPELIRHVLTLQDHWECLQFPEDLGIPDDAQVCDVQWNWERRCFDVMLHHPSFPIVPDGEMRPRINDVAIGMQMFRRVKVPYEAV